jgi:ribosomal silencing factor RsfS
VRVTPTARFVPLLTASRSRAGKPVSGHSPPRASWACLDFDAVIVHVFLPGERTFYDLEGLWNSVAAARAAVD